MFNFRPLLIFVVVAMCWASCAVTAPPIGIPADYNHDGIVSHADYSILGDTFGSLSDLRADGIPDGVIDLQDFDFYRTHYGQTASLPSLNNLTVNSAATSDGNVEWTFVFSNIDGALAGHLNFTSTNSSPFNSVTPGPLFHDDEIDPIGVPGASRDLGVLSGVSIVPHNAFAAFAALGTSLPESPSLFNSHSTLEFARLVTLGQSPTTLSYDGEFGYQGQDYIYQGSASFEPDADKTSAPEPWSLVVWTGLAMAAVAVAYLRRPAKQTSCLE
jgi:hypothetical protein